ncbi:nitroreductase [Aquicoccus sp. SCR17]|nr:nitroreductase [Carideicomes alvinocaridis]
MTDRIEAGDFEALDRVMRARFSCRAFRDEALPRDLIARIVETAQQVPSWCNAQPWQLTITSGPATEAFRAALQAAVDRDGHDPDIAFPDSYDGIYRDRRRTCGWQLYEAVGVEKGDRDGSARQMRRNFDFFGAPHVAVVTTPRALGTYGAVDCGAFVTGFCLAAQALGVATIPQAAVAGYSKAVHAHLGLDPERDVVCAISFGRPDMDHPANAFRTGRAGPEEVIDWR